MVRKIIAYKDYYSKFMNSLQESERLKIQRALLLFLNNDRIPFHYIKYLRDDIYEFRVTHLGNEFRLFFCYDGDALVILFNGIKKKRRRLQEMKLIKQND